MKGHQTPSRTFSKMLHSKDQLFDFGEDPVILVEPGCILCEIPLWDRAKSRTAQHDGDMSSTECPLLAWSYTHGNERPKSWKSSHWSPRCWSLNKRRSHPFLSKIYIFRRYRSQESLNHKHNLTSYALWAPELLNPSTRITRCVCVLVSGSVSLAFMAAIGHYLSSYQATVLTLDRQVTLLELNATTTKLRNQIEFVADFCKPSLPFGVCLISHIYKTAVQNFHSDNYALLLYFLRSTSWPYLRFLQDWLFEGRCDDVFGEYKIQADDAYLCCRDRSYWTHGYVLLQSSAEETNVPVFLQNIGKDVFLCGKSLNLLKLCNPNVSSFCALKNFFFLILVCLSGFAVVGACHLKFLRELFFTPVDLCAGAISFPKIWHYASKECY